MAKEFDVCVIGSGPGGYVAAIRASQLGFNTAIVEKRHLGGVCLNIGCIPTKALLRSAEVYENVANASDYGINVEDYSVDFPSVIKRSRKVANKMSKGVQFLMKANDIDVFMGKGVLESKNEVKVLDDNEKESERIQADKIIVATGARPNELPNIPIDGEKVVGYEQGMQLDEQPEKMVVIGAGAIGIEFAYFYQAMGTEVSIVEVQDTLVPLEDPEIGKELAKIYKKKGMNIYTNSSVEKVNKKRGRGSGLKVDVKTKDGTETIEADIVLSAVGVKGNVEGIGLDEVGVEHENNHIKVDRTTFQTSVDNIYAIGDVAGAPWLAHKATHEALNCVERMAGEDPMPVNYDNIPACTYCEPQIASVGYTEQEAKDEGYDVKVGKFPFSANGKATGMGHQEGFVKVVFDEKYGEWLGCQMIGHGVTEMIAEVVAARELETTGHEIIHSQHPHPTMSEAVMEAVAEAYKVGVHLGTKVN